MSKPSKTFVADNRFRIVVPLVAGIGNSIMAIPMLRQLKRGKPDAILTVLARTSAIAEPARRLAEVDEHIVCGDGNGGAIRMIKESRKRKPDWLVIPFPSNRWQYNLLRMASGAKQAVVHNYPTPDWKSLDFGAATRIPAERMLHDVVQNLRLLEPLGIAIDRAEQPVFPLTADDRMTASAKLTQAGIDPAKPFIVVHAGSAATVLAAAKRWPPERYAALVQTMARVYQMPIVVVEGPDERGVAKSILDQVDVHRAKAIAMPLGGPLGEAGGILAMAKLYVGTDSGLAHLASAVGTKAVTLFAPADPERVCPSGCRSLVVQAPKMCSPCFQYPWETCKPAMRCNPPYCIEDISIEAVMAKVKLGM
jgi:ADP-heptose:LPS heptosyltransferase